SNGAAGQFYDYVFNVHQPYLGAGRDSLSLVIADTSHAISTRQVRTRLGAWLDARTVVEAWADWFDNRTSLANPTHPARNDSTQRLCPAAFSAATFGGTAARVTDAHALQASFRHATWTRALTPRDDPAGYALERASGSLDVLDAAWTL